MHNMEAMLSTVAGVAAPDDWYLEVLACLVMLEHQERKATIILFSINAPNLVTGLQEQQSFLIIIHYLLGCLFSLFADVCAVHLHKNIKPIKSTVLVPNRGRSTTGGLIQNVLRCTRTAKELNTTR